MQFNVAQLLQEPIGSIRHYDLVEDIHDLDAEMKKVASVFSFLIALLLIALIGPFIIKTAAYFGGTLGAIIAVIALVWILFKTK